MLHLAPPTMGALALAFLLGSATTVGAGEPFLELDLAQALERAKADGKPVFVAWSSVGSSDCRRMELTYADEANAKWIRARTIPIMIDGDQRQRLAVQYAVSGYPQVTLLDAEGALMGRIEGYFDATDFMTRLEASVVAHEGPVERPEGESEQDPKAWLAYGNYLYGLRQEPKAVVQAYLFCLDSGEARLPGFEATYLDFLLNRLNLMHKVVSTRPGLRSRRDRLGATLSAGTAGPREAKAFLRYNFWLLDTATSVAMYDELAAGDEHQQALRAILFEELLVELVAQRRYTDVLDSAGEVVPGLIARIEAYSPAGDPKLEGDEPSLAAKTDPGLRDTRNGIITDAVHLYEAQLGAGRGATAAQLVDVLVEAFPSGRVYSLLMQHAMRLELYDLVRALAERGRRELGDKAEKMIQRALRKLPREQRVGTEKVDKGR